jgi:hypothetical protein
MQAQIKLPSSKIYKFGPDLRKASQIVSADQRRQSGVGSLPLRTAQSRHARVTRRAATTSFGAKSTTRIP